MAQFSVNAQRFDPYKNFKFRVKWDGRYVAGISKVSSLKRSTEVVEHREGGDPSTSRKSPGRTKFEAITLDRGVTHDVAVFPDGAGDEDFLWRASLATIAAAGPFSSFPGVDRALLLLTGELVIEVGGAIERLRPGAPALNFAGEDCVSAAPIGGACTVLNIMTRRGAMSARLARWMAAQPNVAETLLLASRQLAAPGARATRTNESVQGLLGLHLRRARPEATSP